MLATTEDAAVILLYHLYHLAMQPDTIQFYDNIRPEQAGID